MKVFLKLALGICFLSRLVLGQTPATIGPAATLDFGTLPSVRKLRLEVTALPASLLTFAAITPDAFQSNASHSDCSYRVETNDEVVIAGVLRALSSEPLKRYAEKVHLDIRLSVRLIAGKAILREYFFDTGGYLATAAGVFEPEDGGRWLRALWQAVRSPTRFDRIPVSATGEAKQ